MGSPLYEALGNQPGQMADAQNPAAQMRNIQQAFNSFRQSFQGDPKQAVMAMLQRGQISRQQVERAQQMAQRFSWLMGGDRNG